jgi:penicillin-binding protein 1C
MSQSADQDVKPNLSRLGKSRRSRLWRVLRVTVAAACLCVVAGVGAGAWYVHALGPVPLGDKLDYSKLVVDRNGTLLRAYTTSAGRWRLPAQVDDIDPSFFKALFAYEDKRFRSHHGVDPHAMARALSQLVTNGHVVSGASTLSMQVARLLEPRDERTLSAKLRQVVRAIQLERKLSKDQILSLYLGLAPYGGNLEGLRAASLAYFGHEPRHLTAGEAALLVALPQSPEVRRPDRSVTTARAARQRVLARLADAHVFPADEIVRARSETVPSGRKAMPILAPHAADQAVASAPERRIHRLTLDATLQHSLEELARDRARSFGPDISIAIVAVDHATGEILARVASAAYFDTRRAGQVDMTQALRSPGSTLKPFIYGMAFEDGLVHPETLIEDRPVRYGVYAPENFDMTFQGTVSVRKALQMSLNVPAVNLLDRVGASRLSTRLGQAGGTLVLPKGEVPGLAIALGGAGIKLTDLTMLYAGLARLGTTVPLIERRDQAAPPVTPQRLIEEVAAWQVGNVLLGAPPPEHAAPGRIAFKTGTSYGYRDAWAVGYDGRMTVGVWVGRSDGAPVPGLYGRANAAPVLFDVFARAGRPPQALPPAPKGVLFATNSRLPPPLQRFRPEGVAAEGGEARLRILFPPNGAKLELAAQEGKPDPVAMKIGGGVQPLTVLVNGLPVPAPSGQRTVFFSPDGPGFVRLTVMDATGAADSVMVRLQ